VLRRFRESTSLRSIRPLLRDAVAGWGRAQSLTDFYTTLAWFYAQIILLGENLVVKHGASEASISWRAAYLARSGKP